jgi:hypothetical protein
MRARLEVIGNRSARWVTCALLMVLQILGVKKVVDVETWWPRRGVDRSACRRVERAEGGGGGVRFDGGGLFYRWVGARGVLGQMRFSTSNRCVS